MSKLKLFFISALLTASVVLVGSYVDHVRPKRYRHYAPLIPIFGTDGMFLTSQLMPGDAGLLNQRYRIRTIVDIRPDGEERNQPLSSEIASTGKKYGIQFHYIPVPHGSIPDTAVEELAHVVATEPKPMLLYCRTGRRAIRLFALEEASRIDGPDSDAILAMTRATGFSAADLKTEIDQRISHRHASATAIR